MKHYLYSFCVAAVFFVNLSAHAGYQLSTVCETSLMDMMTRVSVVNLGAGKPYFMGMANENAVKFTGNFSSYTATFNAPIFEVTMMYEDVCVAQFTVHNGQENCFVSAMSYECR